VTASLRSVFPHAIGVVSRHSFSLFSQAITVGFDPPATHEVIAAKINACWRLRLQL
jgi:hypothetical protein